MRLSKMPVFVATIVAALIASVPALTPAQATSTSVLRSWEHRLGEVPLTSSIHHRRTPRQLCISVRCKRREWIKHHPQSRYPSAGASWYDLEGNGLACGGVYTAGLLGVAHKTLPCGTIVELCYARCARIPVVDRGPYVAGREFDLTVAAKEAIGFGDTGSVKWKVIHLG